MEGAAASQIGRSPTLILRVDPASPVPPYEQIRAQVATGVLAEAARSFALQVAQLGVEPEVALARARQALEEFAT